MLRSQMARASDLAAQLRYLQTTGMRTAGRVRLEELGHDRPDRTFYEATEWSTLRRVLPPAAVGLEDVFLDIGSGMGRTLLLASRYRFRRVVGVEVAPPLAEIARRNLARLGADDVELLIADVTTLDVPDDVTVVFLNNPFTGETFSRAMERIVASLERRPRRVRLIYRNPLEHERVMATGCARVVGEIRSGRRRAGPPVVTYELGPAAPPVAAATDSHPVAPQAER